jgi:alpha-tubulin suppressor-like RCC1 family protein
MTCRSSILLGFLAMGFLLLGCGDTTVQRPLFGGGGGISGLGGDLIIGGDTSEPVGGSAVGGIPAGGIPAATGGVVGAGGSTGGGGSVSSGGQTGMLVPATPAIALGSSHTCALASDGTVKCWGSNFSGQIGDGTMTPAYYSPIALAGLTNVTQIALGGGHTCVLLSDSTVKCWGGNPTGELGYATTAKCADPANLASMVDCSRTPAVVSGLTGVTQLSVAGAEQSVETAGYSCALLANGSVQCWGANTSGQLGDGTTTNRASPTAVSGLANVQQIAAGKNHACALLKDGTVKCWGVNGNGQLGDGTNLPRLVPTLVTGLQGVTSIAVGGFQTCAVLFDTTMKCWGANSFGELGDGTTVDRNQPTLVPGLTGIASVSLGDEHSCVLLNDGSVQCCGKNDAGQVGDGTTSAAKTFAQISGLNGVAQIALGGAHSGARMQDGSMKCWGSNASGGIGDGTQVPFRSTPTAVIGFIGTGIQKDGGAGGAGGSDAGLDGGKGGVDGSASGGAGRGDAGLDRGVGGAPGKDAASDAADAPAIDAGDGPAVDADGGSAGDADGGEADDGGATACNNIDISLASVVTPTVLAATIPPAATGGTIFDGVYYLTSAVIYTLDNPAPTTVPTQEIMVVSCTTSGQCTIQIASKLGSAAVQHFTLSAAVPTGVTVSGTTSCPAGGGSVAFGYSGKDTALTIFTASDTGAVTVATLTKQAAGH